METERSSLKARPLLWVATLLFFCYVANILLGMLAIQYSVDVAYLGNVWEFSILFASVVGYVVFILLNEKDESSP